MLAQRRREAEQVAKYRRPADDFNVDEAVETALREGDADQAGRAKLEAPRAAAGDPARLRGIPMIGGAAGAIPGTVPHRQRRLDGWAGR